MSDRLKRAGLSAGAGISLGAALGAGAVAQAADFTVDRIGDPAGAGACAPATPNDCSLRQAVTDAQNGNRPTVDRVLFQSGLTGTITLTAGITMSEPLDIVGPGATILTVSGGDMQRIFDTDQGTAGDPVTISGLTLTQAYGSGVVGGGAIYSSDTDLTIESSTISASTSGAGAEPGGAIRQIGSEVLIRNSTISGNTAGNGGGLHSTNADVGILNSTITGNTASNAGAGYGYGGGVWLDDGPTGSLVAYGATITDNHAKYGGGMSVDATSNGIVNSVISDNVAVSAVDLRNAGADPFKLAFTLVKTPSGANIADIPAFAGSNILGVDPQLGPLAANGGPTLTMKPAKTSPLIDKGITAEGPMDQRGLTRPFDVTSIANSGAFMADAADIGAVELQASDFAQPKPPTTPVAKKCKPKTKKKGKRGAASAKKKKGKKCGKKRKKK